MGNCIVVVQFDLPKRTEEQAVKGATSTAPIYRGLAAKGLIRKDYLNGDAGTGGVYLWETRALAEAWFTEDRIVERCQSGPADKCILIALTCAHNKLPSRHCLRSSAYSRAVSHHL
jgi:hypothetical protein